MHQVLITIMVETIKEQYGSENYFYQNRLGIDDKKWLNFKSGAQPLNEEQMQKIKGLFSDYEWMLVQKILRQTIIFPERRNYAFSQYRRLKTIIAKKWLKNGGAAELISKKTEEKAGRPMTEFIDLKVSMKYGEWGYDDILSFRLPAIVQRQVEGSKVDLLEWVDENLTNTYVHEEHKEV